MTKLAVVGSREMVNYSLLKSTLDNFNQLNPISQIISGGAHGADTLAERYAKENNIPIVIFKPEYEKYPGKIAPLMRNTLIVQSCDVLIAFPSRQSRGTFDSINKAKQMDKQVMVIYID